MPRKLTTAPPAFKILVANLRGSSDPSRGINPVKVRSVFEQQLFPEVPGRGQEQGPGTTSPKSPGLTTRQGLLTSTTPGVPIASTATLTVASNVFTEPAYIYLGNYVLKSNEHYLVGGSNNITAANIAGAINALPEFNATASGAVVSITGPLGPNGNDILFEATYEGTVQNFTLLPTDGSMQGAEPTIGPPVIS